MARLVIHREKALALKLVPFNVFLDGENIGSVLDGQEKEFEIGNGNHDLLITKDRVPINSYNTISFRAIDDTVVVICKGTISDCKIIEYGV